MRIISGLDGCPLDFAGATTGRIGHDLSTELLDPVLRSQSGDPAEVFATATDAKRSAADWSKGSTATESIKTSMSRWSFVDRIL
ncbi:MAG: hypothetical protein ACXW50_24455, partial [Candidatus Binatia bacterium]